MKVKKAVIPAAGWGTRFLPANKAIPKEILPIVDKPIIQYVVEEIISAGIKEIVIVLTPQKQAIRDHFGTVSALEKYLESVNKPDLVKMVRDLANLADFTFINQSGPYGNGTPVLDAKKYIGNNAFAVLWGDEFIYAEPSRLKQMVPYFEKYHDPVISAVRIPKENLNRYGIAKLAPVEKNLFEILEIVEKPKPEEAPSDMATHGAYILTPDIFDALESLTPGKGGEIWLVDGINKLRNNHKIYACEIINGKYYDCGNKLEYLKTVVEFALKREDLAPEFKKYLKSLSL